MRSGIRKKPMPDPGSRGQKGTGSRIPDPGSGSASLTEGQCIFHALRASVTSSCCSTARWQIQATKGGGGYTMDCRMNALVLFLQTGSAFYWTGRLHNGTDVLSIFPKEPVMGIRDPMPFWSLGPGSGMGKKSKVGSRIRDEHTGSFFGELKNNFLG